MTLGNIGPDAKAALPALIRLAESHAPEEWARVKSGQPEPRGRKDSRWKMFADDRFVDAICKIRR